jgi:hypothetical protein
LPSSICAACNVRWKPATCRSSAYGQTSGKAEDSTSGSPMGASEFSSCTELSPPPFWNLPSSNEGISFVDTPQAFEAVVQSLRSAAIVGLDCEWKPIARRRNGALSRGSPKVAVLQIACRRRAQLEDGKREALYVVVRYIAVETFCLRRSFPLVVKIRGFRRAAGLWVSLETFRALSLDPYLHVFLTCFVRL